MPQAGGEWKRSGDDESPSVFQFTDYQEYLKAKIIAIATAITFCLAAGAFAEEGRALDSVDLSGAWNFTPQGAAQTSIKVPGGGWYKQGFANLAEADYARSITVPDAGVPQVTKIAFGAVNYQADLYIDNKLAGTNLTAWTPSVFDISGFVVPGQTYPLRVHVKGRNAFMVNGKSSVPNAAGWSPNLPDGIFRSAFIKAYPQVYIRDAYVRTSVKNQSLQFDVWVTNASSAARNVSLSGVLSAWNAATFSYPAIADRAVTIAAGATQKISSGPISWTLGSASYWWPNVPYRAGYLAVLHNLSITLKEGAAVLHTKTIRFGFREVEQKSDGVSTNYYLNGIRVNFRGENLQGVNYDDLVYGGGRGDAYDTYPGFLPGENGWPKAVDNYQRLDYNFVRLHQEPVTPYMLDVCDEKGQMVMVETAIRGSEGSQDFVAGHGAMIDHLTALFTRDRNHPAVVRWSQSNEPGSDAQFQRDLYNAAMAVDSTRPISVDGASYDELTYANFSGFAHYVDGFAAYSESVSPRVDRPFGQGEFIWYGDNTPQGFMWFATGCQAMRRKNASDIRPYTLLSAWCSFVPGVKRTEMKIEQGYKNMNTSPNPAYGEDNLPDPWSNGIIRRNQAAYNPVLVADSLYWERNKLSDAGGDWPVTQSEPLRIGLPNDRTLTIYNDCFNNSAVDVYWELHNGSPTGPINVSGELHPSIPLGSHVSRSISITPESSSDSVAYLVLISKKDGVEIFRETDEKFLLSAWTLIDDADSAIHYSGNIAQAPAYRYIRYLGPAASYGNIAEMEVYGASGGKLGGTPFGSSPAYSVGTEFDKATDGSTATYFDNAAADGGYAGIDLGSATVIDHIRYWPRNGFEARMNGGKFQGSTTSATGGYSDIATLATPPANQWSTVAPNGWNSISNARYYFGTAHGSGTAGSTASFAFTGVGVRVYGSTRSDLGKMEVTLDGAVKTIVDCYASIGNDGIGLYEITGLASATHTLSLRLTGDKNAASSGTSVLLDAISYLAKQPVAVHAPRPSATEENGLRVDVFGRRLLLPADFVGQAVSIDILDVHGRVLQRLDYSSKGKLENRKAAPPQPGTYIARCRAGQAEVCKPLELFK